MSSQDRLKIAEARGSVVCIDGFNLALPKGSGIATYGRNLAHAVRGCGLSPQVLYGPAGARSRDPLANLAAIADGPPPRHRIDKNERWRRTLTTRFGRKAFPVAPSDQVIWSSTGGGRPEADLFWSCPDLFTLANRAFDKYGVLTPVRFEGDQPPPPVMHWTCPLPVYARDTLNVVTVHDLIPLRLPHTTVDDSVAYARRLKRSLDRADHIVVVSEQTKRDLVEWMHVDESRVTNTYQAVSIPPALAQRDEGLAAVDVENVLNLGWKDYFLYFGAVEPKKNLARVIESHLASGVKAPLVVVGGRGWLDEDENSLLRDLAARADDRVRRFAYMPFHLLISLIRGARGVLFPSLYEGFGLPVLEAMLLGTPVLTSREGSLPEVAGDAALFVDAYDVDSIKRGIQALDADESLRAELSDKGSRQVDRFSMAAYQTRVFALYEGLGVRVAR